MGESSTSSSGMASCGGVSSSESSLPVSSESCSEDSGCCGAAESCTSCSSSSEYSSYSSVSESEGASSEALGESRPRHAEASISHPRGLNPYAAPFDPQQSLNRHLERLNMRSYAEESWTDEDDGSHEDHSVGDKSEQEVVKSPSKDGYGLSTEHAVKKGRKGRSSYRHVMSFNSLPYSGRNSARK